MASKQVLIISNPHDEHTVRVSSMIRALGARTIVLYPEHFGPGLYLALAHSCDNNVAKIMLVNDSGDVCLDDVYSVWYRRPRSLDLKEGTITPEGLAFARDEWRAALEAVYALLKNPLWVSHPDSLKLAARKPIQLQLAQRLHLKIPRTLITNSPSKAKEFYNLCNGEVIIKATGSGWIYSQDKEEVCFVLTNRASPSDIEAVEEIAIAPIILQEEISKKYEIRVNVVGQRVLAVQIDSQNSQISKLDWRRYDLANTPYSPYTLPSDVENKCVKLVKLLGLEFGAIDLICNHDGEYVFLEINGNGNFLWAEDLSGVRISSALANLLSGETPPLKEATLYN